MIAQLAIDLMAAALSGAKVLPWRTGGYFALTTGERPLIHLWSLGIEEQFYLFYPLLVLWVARRGRSSVRAVVLVGMGLSFAKSLSQWDRRPELTFYLLPTRAWELLAGASVALLPAVAPRATWRCRAQMLGLVGTSRPVGLPGAGRARRARCPPGRRSPRCWPRPF